MILGCPVGFVRIKGDRISGLFHPNIHSLKLTAKAPENGWLEYFLVSFWGVGWPISRDEKC